MNEKYLWEELGLDKNFSKEDVNKAFLKLENKSHKAIFAWKVLRDRFYGELYRKYKDVDLLIKAGFIEANIDYNEDADFYNLNLLTTTVGKLLNNKNIDSSKQPVVLLSTGGFYPLHDGHFHMMKLAKKVLENKGFNVIGGYFSPSHDKYVSTKPFYRNTDEFKRIYDCQNSVKDIDWLMIDLWESIYVNTYINFTDVINRLELYLKKHVNKRIKVAYVFGADNADFMYCFENDGIGICVDRANYHSKFLEIKKNIISDNAFFIEDDINKYNISSRDIRRDTIKGLTFNTDISKDKGNKTYIIRNEGLLPFNHYNEIIPQKQLIKAHNDFLKNFIKLMENTFDKKINIKVINIEEQLKKADKELSNKNTISLDSYYNGTYNLSVSRLFDISDIQLKYLSLVGRIGQEPISVQASKIPTGKYTIVDDDSVTGNTLRNVKKYLSKDVFIENTYLLSNIINEQVFDVVDLRDFIVGAENSGLVIRMPNKDVTRVPYLTPYVSLITRASVPYEKELKFSLEIWKFNKIFYQNFKKITIKNISYEHKKIFNYIGFNDNTSIVDICDWHINKLKKLTN